MTKCFTYYDINYTKLASVVLPHFKTFCQKWQYELVAPVSPVGNPYWSKITILSDLLPTTDYLIYSDIDVKILDFAFDFLSPLQNCDAYVASDNYGICCCFMAFRNTAWSRSFLAAVAGLGRLESDISFTEAKNHEEDISDQHTIKALYRLFPSVREKLLVMDDSFLTNKWLNRKGKIYHFVAHEFTQDDLIKQVKDLCYPRKYITYSD